MYLPGSALGLCPDFTLVFLLFDVIAFPTVFAVCNCSANKLESLLIRAVVILPSGLRDNVRILRFGGRIFLRSSLAAMEGSRAWYFIREVVVAIEICVGIDTLVGTRTQRVFLR